MAKFDEMPLIGRLGIMVLVAAILCGGVYYLVHVPIAKKNAALEAQVKDKEAENRQLKQYEPKLNDLNARIVQLQQQIEVEKKIVPEDKDADQFIKLLHDTASLSGIEIRRYTAVPGANHEFYSEVPFAIDIDGPYYSVLNFFERVARLERIVTISNLQMSNVKVPGPSKSGLRLFNTPASPSVSSCRRQTSTAYN